MKTLPLYSTIDYKDPFELATYISSLYPENFLFLDSNGYPSPSFETGKFSYICFDPQSVYSFANNTCLNDGKIINDHPFDALKKSLKALQDTYTHNNQSFQTQDNLPPFQGGFAGYFGYELLHTLETIPCVNDVNTQHLHDMHIAYYDLVIAFDHALQKAWIISIDPNNAQNRLHFALAMLSKSEIKPDTNIVNAPLLPNTLTCSYGDQASYENAIERTLDYIKAGDIFQANITRKLFATLPENVNLLSLYKRLRTINPAPFSVYFKWHQDSRPCAILSSSPERFVSVSKYGIVETRPIKGTRRRGASETEDLTIISELQNCIKDRAENMMIVDLMRNDLSKVCQPFTVQTPKLCAIESYKTVHHLVSTVTGKLKDHLNCIDLLKAAFPGGSITGAPKVRAMEIINELENVRRGPYCGSMAFIGIDGAMDTSIMIRSLVVNGSEISFHVGGGIVADSTPHDEYTETCTKAQALVKTLTNETLG